MILVCVCVCVYVCVSTIKEKDWCRTEHIMKGEVAASARRSELPGMDHESPVASETA